MTGWPTTHVGQRRYASRVSDRSIFSELWLAVPRGWLCLQKGKKPVLQVWAGITQRVTHTLKYELWILMMFDINLISITLAVRIRPILAALPLLSVSVTAEPDLKQRLPPRALSQEGEADTQNRTPQSFTYKASSRSVLLNSRLWSVRRRSVPICWFVLFCLKYCQKTWKCEMVQPWLSEQCTSGFLFLFEQEEHDAPTLCPWSKHNVFTFNLPCGTQWSSRLLVVKVDQYYGNLITRLFKLMLLNAGL